MCCAREWLFFLYQKQQKRLKKEVKQAGDADIVMTFLLLLFFSCRDQEWQLKEHPGPLLHLVALQAAAAATAAVLPVPGRTQSADRQWRHAISWQPQGTRHAVQVQCTLFFNRCLLWVCFSPRG